MLCANYAINLLCELELVFFSVPGSKCLQFSKEEGRENNDWHSLLPWHPLMANEVIF